MRKVVHLALILPLFSLASCQTLRDQFPGLRGGNAEEEAPAASTLDQAPQGPAPKPQASSSSGGGAASEAAAQAPRPKPPTPSPSQEPSDSTPGTPSPSPSPATEDDADPLAGLIPPSPSGTPSPPSDGDSASDPSADPAPTPTSRFRQAVRIPGEPNMVRSPYAPDGPKIDIEGYSSGAAIYCPVTNNIITVP